MKGIGKVLVVAVAGCHAALPAAANERVVNHVVLIGVDGMGARNIAWSLMPNLRRLRDEGLYATARATYPTSSGVNWTSALCGTTPDMHGVRDNKPTPDVTPAVTTARGMHPCIFNEVRRQEPSAYTCSFYDWEGIGWYHDSASASFTQLCPTGLESETAYTGEFIDRLAGKPRLAFITYDMLDHAGHDFGWSSPEYSNVCARIDGFIGRIADHVAANMSEDTAIVVFADHGGHDRNHGDITLESYEIPFLVHAPGLSTYKFREPVTICDVAPTVAWLLGYDIPDFWRGRPALRKGERSMKKRIVMHAGKGSGAPENTLPAFTNAVCLGFGFECDIQMSADNRIFLAHNSSAKSYGGPDAEMKTLPWDEISKIDIGIAVGGSVWAGVHPPLLEDVLPLMRDGRKSFVEVKESAGTEIVPHIKALFEAQGTATPQNTEFISFDRDICRALRAVMPEYGVMWLTTPRRDDPERTPLGADELIAELTELGVTGVDIQCDTSVLTEEFVKTVKDAGFSLCVWTVDDERNARILFERGVDRVTTNRAREITEILKNWAWKDELLED